MTTITDYPCRRDISYHLEDIILFISYITTVYKTVYKMEEREEMEASTIFDIDKCYHNVNTRLVLYMCCIEDKIYYIKTKEIHNNNWIYVPRDIDGKRHNLYSYITHLHNKDHVNDFPDMYIDNSIDTITYGDILLDNL
jgi:hypothetical protein